MDMLINTNDLFDNHIYLLVHRHDLLSEFLDIQMDMLLGQLGVVVLNVLQVLVNVAERPEFETYKYAYTQIYIYYLS